MIYVNTGEYTYDDVEQFISCGINLIRLINIL
jgi:hypothetical protein